MKRELTPADCLYSVKVGTLFGFFAGWAIGVALIFYVDSPALNQWPLVPSIPLWNALGWATYGFVIGGSGIFANVGRRSVDHLKDESTPLTPAA